MRMLIWSLLLSFTSGVFAARIPIQQSLTSKKGTYLQDGVFIGGKAGNGTSLLGARHSYSAKAHIERLILDLGDKDAQPTGNNLGYFHASVDAKKNRVVLDLSQLLLSKISEQQIKELFKKSPYVASAEFTVDPQDKVGTLVLQLKRPMRLEVFELIHDKKPGRVVLDLAPAPTTQYKAKI